MRLQERTGYTSNALSTLITLADNGNMKLVCVVLRTHGVNIYPDTKNLFEYAFNNFQKIQVADEKKPDEVEKFISAADIARVTYRHSQMEVRIQNPCRQAEMNISRWRTDM